MRNMGRFTAVSEEHVRLRKSNQATQTQFAAPPFHPNRIRAQPQLAFLLYVCQSSSPTPIHSGRGKDNMHTPTWLPVIRTTLPVPHHLFVGPTGDWALLASVFCLRMSLSPDV